MRSHCFCSDLERRRCAVLEYLGQGFGGDGNIERRAKVEGQFLGGIL